MMSTKIRWAVAIALVACVGAVLPRSAEAAAGCGGNEKAKKVMERVMKDAAKLASDGEFKLAFEKYQQAESMGACPIMAKDCKKQMAGLIQEAKDAVDEAKALSKNKEAEENDVLNCLCKLFELQLGWRGHAISRDVGKASKTLKRKKKKLLRAAMKAGDKEVLAQVKEADPFLRKGDLRSALNCYDRIFTTYPYSKKAGKYLARYMALRQKVKELDAEEARRAKVK